MSVTISSSSRTRRPVSGASFTGSNSVRHPAPDVARGFMLLLIALANVHYWYILFTSRAEAGTADTVWLNVRAVFVDQRSYPLFALLFGFGLATMARRRIETDTRQAELSASGVGAAAQGSPAGAAVGDVPVVIEDEGAGRVPAVGETEDAGRASAVSETDAVAARESATVAARRLVRRRGLWMLLFGAVHGMAFAGDVIGTYALIATAFAGTVVRRKRVRMLVVGGLFTLVSLGYMGYLGWAFTQGATTVGSVEASSQGTVAGVLELLRSPLYPLLSVVLWSVGAVMMMLTSLALPAVFLGARLAETDLLARPDRHRRALVIGGVTALAVGAAGAVPSLLPHSEMDLPTWFVVVATPLDVATGLVGACGWLALLAAWAGPGTGAPLRGARWVLAAVGRRSMTAYVGQTVLFGLVFVSLSAMGLQAPPETTMALIAVAVWAVLAGACSWMERAGFRRGPLEVALRRAVAVSARRR